MYTPPHFALNQPEQLHRIIHAHPLGVLVTFVASTPSDLWAVAASDANEGTILHFDGRSWSQRSEPVRRTTRPPRSRRGRRA